MRVCVFVSVIVCVCECVCVLEKPSKKPMVSPVKSQLKQYNIIYIHKLAKLGYQNAERAGANL